MKDSRAIRSPYRASGIAMALAGVAMLLGGCAGTEEAPPTTTAPADTTTPDAVAEATATASPAATAEPAADPLAELTVAATAYTTAYFAADFDTAVGLWSTRCRTDNDKRNEFLGTLLAVNAVYGERERPAATSHVAIDRLEGDLALITYSYVDSGVEQTISSQPWLLEDGRWTFDDC